MFILKCFFSRSQVAIKSIRKERITDDLDRIHIQREIEITSSLRHTNIIRFHEGKTRNFTQVGKVRMNYPTVSSTDECFKRELREKMHA